MFFISVGMSLNIGVLWQYLPQILIGVIVLVTVKMVVLYLLAHLTCPRAAALTVCRGAGQGGEFAFVLFLGGAGHRVIPRITRWHRCWCSRHGYLARRR
ncbi:cation:proton antiporter [Shigella flexneri]